MDGIINSTIKAFHSFGSERPVNQPRNASMIRFACGSTWRQSALFHSIELKKHSGVLTLVRANSHYYSNTFKCVWCHRVAVSTRIVCAVAVELASFGKAIWNIIHQIHFIYMNNLIAQATTVFPPYTTAISRSKRRRSQSSALSWCSPSVPPS